MTVREYYQKNFKKLTPEAQFHFAISLKNWFDTTDYNDFIKDNEPSHDLTELFNDNSHTDIDNYELCKPFLEKKYKGLLGIERALLRVNCLLSEYKIDLRRDLLKLIRKDELFTLADNLLADDSATTVLSTHAINTICIIDILFPRKKDVFALLARKALHPSSDPVPMASLAADIIINDTCFFTRPITMSNLPIYEPLISFYAKLISQNLTPISLEAKLKFLICCKLINAAKNPSANAIKNNPVTLANAPTGFLPLAQKIQIECQSNLRKSPFLLDPRQPDKDTPSLAEPLNVSYILSGLDQ